MSPLRSALRALAMDGAERQAVAAGEIDAVIDYSSRNVILLPLARRALEEAGKSPREAASANSLLAGVPQADYECLLPCLEPLTLKLGEVLHQPGMPVRHAYFPIDCVVAVLAEAQGQGSLGVGLVGYEGMIGIALVLGAEASFARALVQSSGTALRVDAAVFQKALQRSEPLQHALYRYAFAKLTAARQAVACHCFHRIEARLARWLLMTCDRLRSDECALAQVHLAAMLGVRRATINAAAGLLQQRGLIAYRRARITILDRPGLRASACGCYTSARI